MDLRTLFASIIAHAFSALFPFGVLWCQKTRTPVLLNNEKAATHKGAAFSNQVLKSDETIT